MGTKVRFWGAAAVAAVCAAGASPLATAQSPASMTLTGSWIGTDATLLGLKFAGPNVFVSFDAVAVYSGDRTVRWSDRRSRRSRARLRASDRAR
jgi:hypothetical protein